MSGAEAAPSQGDADGEVLEERRLHGGPAVGGSRERREVLEVRRGLRGGAWGRRESRARG